MLPPLLLSTTSHVPHSQQGSHSTKQQNCRQNNTVVMCINSTARYMYTLPPPTIMELGLGSGLLQQRNNTYNTNHQHFFDKKDGKFARRKLRTTENSPDGIPPTTNKQTRDFTNATNNNLMSRFAKYNITRPNSEVGSPSCSPGIYYINT